MQIVRVFIFCLSLALLFGLWITQVPNTTAQSNEVWQNYTHITDIQDVLVKDGDLWIATRQAGVTRWNPATNQVISYTADLGYLDSNGANALAMDKAGHIWAGTSNGLSEFDGQSWQIYTIPFTPEYKYNPITAVAIDNQGRKWLGTNFGGVVGFDDGQWQPYTQSDGLLSDAVLSIATDQEQHIWAGTAYSSLKGESGVNEFDGQSWHTYTVADGLGHNQINVVFIDQAGDKWFGTEGGGVSRFDGSIWTTYTAADGLGSNIIYDLTVDESGQIWAGTSGGVSVFDGKTWTTYTTHDGLIDNVVKAIAIDEAGHKWFGTAQGLSRFDDSHWTPSTPTLPLVTAAPVTVTQSYKEWSPRRVVDSEAGRIYTGGSVDETQKTLVLALADERLLATYDLVGDLGLDAVNGWLYIDQGAEGLAVVNTRSNRLHTVIPLPVQQEYGSSGHPLADSTTGRVMVARDNVVYIADPATGLIVDTIATDVINIDHVRQVSSIAWMKYDDTARLLYLDFHVHSCISSMSGDCGIYVIVSYDFATGTEITRTETAANNITAVGGYLVQGRFFCPGASCYGWRQVWRDGQPWFYSTGWKDWGGPIDFDPVRQRFYEVTDTHLRVYDTETMALTMYLTRPMTGTFEGYNPQTDALQFRPDGQLQQWPINNIRPPDPEPLTASPVPTTPVVFVAASPDWPATPTLFAAWADPTSGRNVPDPTSVDRQYQCAYSPLLYISRDGGQSWGRPWGGIRGSCGLGATLAVSPNYTDDQTLLAELVGLGIFKSTDGGELWQPSGAGLTKLSIQDILLSPNFAGDQTAFVVAGDNSGREIYRSTDGGASWQSLKLKLPFNSEDDAIHAFVLSPEFDRDQTLMVTIYHHTVGRANLYRSDDAGDSWQLVSQLPEEIQSYSLILAPLFAKWQTMFISSANQTLYRSTDGGHNWSAVLTLDAPNASLNQIVFAPGIEENRPVFLLSDNTLYRSDDGGHNWHIFETPDGIAPTTLTISPNFAQDGMLLVGTVDGQVVSLHVDR